MKKLPLIITSVVSVILASCGGLDSTALKSSGIHDRKTPKIVSKSIAKNGKSYRTSSAFFKSSSSSNGFHPAEVSASALKKAAKLPKDKHGMPTYPASTRTRLVRTTAYSHMEMEPGAPWKKNALGTYLKYGSVRSAAADWSVLPVGTKFKIKGLPHTYMVDDYGSALAGTNTVDIYHPSLSLMRKWGTRHAEITVIQWGSWERTLAILKGRVHYPHTRRMYYAAKRKVDSGKVARR